MQVCTACRSYSAVVVVLCMYVERLVFISEGAWVGNSAVSWPPQQKQMFLSVSLSVVLTVVVALKLL